MVLAFKLYGDFHWPPTPEPALQPTKTGTIEVHYAQRGGNNLHAFLRWVPRGVPDTAVELPTENIYRISDAAQWFVDHQEQVASLWIDNEVSAKNISKVAFRGAFLIDQYETDAAGKPRLDLRLPLVTACAYRKNKTVYSELVVARISGSAIFRFNLHLPLPVRRTTLPTGRNHNPASFPFCVVYPTRRPAEKILDFTTLVGGWIGAGDGQTSFVFDGSHLPKRRRLGQFGFAALAAGAGKDFAAYEGSQYLGGSKVDPFHFWPRSSEAFVHDVLSRSGFAVPERKSWLTVNPAQACDLSLRFRAEEGGGHTLVYRMRVVATADPAEPGDEDIRSYDGLALRLAPETGGWLRTADTVHVECTLSWNIPDDAIFEDRARHWKAFATVKLLWDERIAPGFAAPPQKDGILFAGTLAQAAHSLSAARKALQATEGGQPQSFLPDLVARTRQTVRFALYAPRFTARFLKDGNFLVWGRPERSGKTLPVFPRPRMWLSLASEADLVTNYETPKSVGLKLALGAEQLSFFTNTGMRCDLILSHDESWRRETAKDVADGDPFFASFALDVAGQRKWQGRLSSLQFRRSRADGEEGDDETPVSWVGKEAHYLRVAGPGARYGMGHGAAPISLAAGYVAALLRIIVPLSRVEPVAVDVARTDRSGRPTPLLIPLDQSAGGAGIAFHLQVTEQISPTQDRLLEVDLLEDGTDGGSGSYVLLSQEPFSLMRFTQRPLGDRGDLGSASVAFYSSDTRVWEFRRVNELFHYRMASQVAAESADKPRRLEIHDLPDGEVEMPPRPFVSDLDEDTGKPARFQSGLKRRAVEFRLTPSAEIWIRPSDVERGYFMPESSSHEIFRQRGEYGLGAPLAFVRAEFLYGLSVGIDVAKERTVARFARIAEIEALTGRIVGNARERHADAALRDRWNGLSQALARRPERLEVWARDPDATVDFAPARFSDGVNFALRATALHRALLKALEDETDYSEPPKGGQGRAPVPGAPRYHPQGLGGGALWPVESVNLFKVLLERPESRGGAIEVLAFTPLGGDATQKAEFLGGIVTILSETRNGFVERQKVEVLGRICALWHRAKHVVVYERTVNASAQFAPKRGEDPDGTRSRRPILRKVREYIELLEPERTYPDFDNAAARSAGFLERVRFNSRIINVDSAWSSEVGDYGWQIPLWNRLSARERPQVYPMPDIAFVTVAEGEGEKPVAAQECRDPDFLFFFADFKAITSDTDAWPARIDLDFANIPAAQAMMKALAPARPQNPADSGGGDPRQASVSRFLPGLRRFTWRLAPAAQKTAINAGRASKPVYVSLDSVTFMRASHVAAVEKPLHADLGKLLAGLAELTPDKEPPAIRELTYWDAAGNDSSVPDGAGFSGLVKDLRDALAAEDPGRTGTALAALKAKWGQHPGSYAQIVADSLKPRAKDAQGFLDGLKGALGSFADQESPCEKMKSDAVGMIRRKQMLIRSGLSEWTDNARAVLPDNFEFTTKAALIEALLDRSTAYIEPHFSEASQDVGKAGEGAEKAHAIIRDLDSEFEAMVTRARQRVEEFVAGYDRDKPWSPGRIRSLHAGLRACTGNVAADISALIGEARQRFASELDDASQAIGGYLAKALSEIAQQRAGALSDLGSFADKLELHTARAALDRLAPDGKPGQIDTAIVRINDAIVSVNNEGRIDAALKGKVLAALQALRTAASDAKTTVSNTRQQLDKMEAQGDEALDQAAATVASLAEALSSVVTALAGTADEVIVFAKELSDLGFDTIANAFKAIWPDVESEIGELAGWVETRLAPLAKELADLGKLLDFLIASALARLDGVLEELRGDVDEVEARITAIVDDVAGALKAAQLALAPQGLLATVVREKVLRPALEELLRSLTEADLGKPDEALARIRQQMRALGEAIEEPIGELSAATLGALDEVSLACGAALEGVDKARSYLQALATDAEKYLDTKAEELKAAFGTVTKRIEDAIGGSIEDFGRKADALLATVNALDHSVRGLQNDLARSTETARMYGERAFGAASRLTTGGPMAAPSNILKLYSAVTSAPELAALKADIDRIRSGYDELSDIIDTTETKALFNRLGDELKALGLSLPFDRIGDRLLPSDLSGLDIGAVFRNLGGAKLDGLFKGFKLPAGVRDAIKVTHDFDKAQARAWVQLDINAPMPGRRSLFSVGPFSADFVDMAFTGRVRLEASKDEDRPTESGFGRIDTSIDIVVGGQSILRFDKFALAFTREKGLEIEFDPKNIRLNPSFKFIQDFLSTLFPDEIGGLKLVKRDGVPVGIEHEFAIPPLALNFGTSGISNLSIENRFKLLAYPDFMLADRFNLSTVERPFIFSIFIIGGTGYIQVEAEYRPFDSELMVAVEAGAGGSASLAFAVGPFSGQVFITLSGVLSYRKLIGRPGGGLSIALVLVIAGHVNVAGIATVGIVLMLRMTYRDSGQIDADGTLSVTIRISRFFKITARAGVRYKLRDGKAETATSLSVAATAANPRPEPEFQTQARKLQGARS